MLLIICNKGHEDLLIEGHTYTVKGVTTKGNYILEEVEFPEGFTSFSKDRFEVFGNSLVENWTEDYEKEYWEIQSEISEMSL